MPTAPEIIERMAGELEVYRLFARAMGCPTKEDVLIKLDKLLQKGEGWLASHPERTFITERYLSRRRSLASLALRRLAEIEGEEDSEEVEGEETVPGGFEPPFRLNDLRLETVLAALRQSGAQRIIDLGCGEGHLLQMLLMERQFNQISGVDISSVSLEKARRRLQRALPSTGERLQLLQGALTYKDARFQGYDAASVVEVIEHLDPPRLKAFEQVVFAYARPRTVVVTTPNREYNRLYIHLAEGALRHPDHRFEWIRSEFTSWAERVGKDYGYCTEFFQIGEADPELGAATQMVVFSLCE